MAKSTSNTPKFVQKLAGKPDAVPAMTVFIGYLGPASQRGMSRIYGSPALSSYVEVRTDAILHSEVISGALVEGQSAFWVRKDEAASRGRTAASKAFLAKQQASFLEGDISAQYLPGAGGAMGGGQLLFTTSVPCGITVTIFLSCLPIDCLPTAH